MASDRRDSGPASGRGGGTAPGLGGPGSAPKIPSSGRRFAANAATTTPDPVDFDALNAALSPSSRQRAQDASHESQGRPSASYASSRPHSVPPARIVQEPVDTPAVIVAVDDTVPSAPPHMTTPLGGIPPQHLHAAHAHGHAPRTGMPSSNPMAAAHPASGPHASAPPASYPFTPPQPFPAQRAGHQMTMRMPERPRRARSPTIVVRRRGPSTGQKLVAFMAMLVLVTACGIAVIIWRKPGWLGLVPGDKAIPTSVRAPAGTTPATATPAPTTVAATATPTATVPTTTPTALPAATPATPATAAPPPTAASPSTGAAPKKAPPKRVPPTNPY